MLSVTTKWAWFLFEGKQKRKTPVPCRLTPSSSSTFKMSRFFRRGGESDSESEESEEELMSSGSDDDAPPPPKPTVPVKGVMSRFLKTNTGGDSSSSSSDEDSDDDDSDDSDAPRKTKKTGGDSDGESGDEIAKVVKSAKDKRLDEMEATGKVMENGLKINDWVAISTGQYRFLLAYIALRHCHRIR